MRNGAMKRYLLSAASEFPVPFNSLTFCSNSVLTSDGSAHGHKIRTENKTWITGAFSWSHVYNSRSYLSSGPEHLPLFASSFLCSSVAHKEKTSPWKRSPETVLSSVLSLRITQTHHLFQPELWQIHFLWFEAESEGLILETRFVSVHYSVNNQLLFSPS